MSTSWPTSAGVSLARATDSYSDDSMVAPVSSAFTVSGRSSLVPLQLPSGVGGDGVAEDQARAVFERGGGPLGVEGHGIAITGADGLGVVQAGQRLQHVARGRAHPLALDHRAQGVVLADGALDDAQVAGLGRVGGHRGGGGAGGGGGQLVAALPGSLASLPGSAGPLPAGSSITARSLDCGFISFLTDVLSQKKNTKTFTAVSATRATLIRIEFRRSFELRVRRWFC